MRSQLRGYISISNTVSLSQRKDILVIKSLALDGERLKDQRIRVYHYAGTVLRYHALMEGHMLTVLPYCTWMAKKIIKSFMTVSDVATTFHIFILVHGETVESRNDWIQR
jgi:hypothetical protein